MKNKLKAKGYCKARKTCKVLLFLLNKPVSNKAPIVNYFLSVAFAYKLRFSDYLLYTFLRISTKKAIYCLLSFGVLRLVCFFKEQVIGAFLL